MPLAEDHRTVGQVLEKKGNLALRNDKPASKLSQEQTNVALTKRARRPISESAWPGTNRLSGRLTKQTKQTKPLDIGKADGTARDLKSPEYSIGRVLRNRRLALKLTLKQVSTAAGLGVGFLSQVERDQSSPSVGSLIKLCGVLGITVGSLFRAHNSATVIRADARERLNYGGARVTSELLARSGRYVAWIGKLQPNARSGSDYHTIDAEEDFVLVLDGDLVMEVDNERYLLHAGDAMTFDPRAPHRYFNPSNTHSTTSLCMILPPPA
jgi:transcriptional regulator with XRE-family HTH domain